MSTDTAREATTRPDHPALTLDALRLALLDRHDESDRRADDRHKLVVDKFAESDRRHDGHDRKFANIENGGLASRPLWAIVAFCALNTVTEIANVAHQWMHR